MAFIKKGTTIVLVLLLTLSVIAVLVSMTYYRISLGKINLEIEKREAEIDTLSEVLAKTEENLSQTRSLLDLQIKREANLSSLFTDLKTVKEKTEDEKRLTEGKLNETQGELLSIKLELDHFEYLYENLNSSYSILNLSYANLLDDVEDICDDASSLNISDCEDYT